MSAREHILAKLYNSRDQAGWPVPMALEITPPQPSSAAEKCAQLKAMMAAVHTEIYELSSENWPGKVTELMHAKHLKNLLIAPQTATGRQLQDSWPSEGPVLKYYQQQERWKEELFFSVDAALTGCRSAVAETGSLVLWPTPAEPRLMSLVPPVHFVVLDSRNIYATLPEVMQAENWAAAMPTNALLISGPSKTADIQQTLAYGAHGPKELVLLIIA
ncbi:LutC/YkgG family protein [Iodobacter ciconiae]|uniref:Lactate utilization protein n=1 Tax=Iodobacter ciconiae TaxID=2496266 RepID=A0A3S8ZTJ5_9NEIS|nr:lactate utilization protein [Iodobacter ciconiae]AZN36830.1 lactate utilization protein [Iodobacter ciconiae]